MIWKDHMYGTMGQFDASVTPIVINLAKGGIRYQISFGRTVYLSGTNMESAKLDAVRVAKRELRKAVKELVTPRPPKRKARRRA